MFWGDCEVSCCFVSTNAVNQKIPDRRLNREREFVARRRQDPPILRTNTNNYNFFRPKTYVGARMKVL